MKLRIALGQMEIIPGHPDLNTANMLQMIDAARRQQAEIIIFPEMAVTGYLLGDVWEQVAFLKDCERYGQCIVQASKGLCVIFGNVYVDWQRKNADGSLRRYNALYIAQDGELMVEKGSPYPCRIKYLSDDCQFASEERYFYNRWQSMSGQGSKIRNPRQPLILDIASQPVRLGLIFEDGGWGEGYSSDLPFTDSVDLVVNPVSRPFALGDSDSYRQFLARQARKAKAPLVYVNNTGIQNNGQTVYIFDGCSIVYNSRGEISACCPPFEADLKVMELAPNYVAGGFDKKDLNIDTQKGDGNYQLCRALIYGIKKFMGSIGMKKAVIGLSGGLDSAVAACLYTEALGAENALLVNMPSIYSSQTTKGLAARLAANLGCPYMVIPIQKAVDYTIEQISHTPITHLGSGCQRNLLLTSFMAENIQARDRSARILAAAAAAFGGGFTCNANKSEITIGYTTLYADQAGFLAAQADLWKYQVYDLAECLNNQIYGQDIIPPEIIELIPSAELSFEQSVEAGKGDPLTYPYHDYLLRAFVEQRVAPEDILCWYMGEELERKIGCQAGLVRQLFNSPAEFLADLERWWRQYTGIGIAKRIQAPPVLAVSRRPYGPEFPEVQNGVYFTSRYLETKKQLLSKEPK